MLGIRQGATENATVAGELLGDLMNRGLNFAELRLYVLDGGKALHAAGDSAPIQRCQVRKRRNIFYHLTDEHKPYSRQETECRLRPGRLRCSQAGAERGCIVNSWI